MYRGDERDRDSTFVAPLHPRQVRGRVDFSCRLHFCIGRPRSPPATNSFMLASTV